MSLTKTLTIKISENDLERFQQMHLDYIKYKGVVISFPEYLRKRLRGEDGA